jgi:DNA-binding Lrp family transcriptional regulator
MALSVHNRERRSRLLDLIRVRGFAALEELVRELGVSESTVRRDLDALEEQGSARRTHGGVLYAGGMPRLAEFDDRQPANWSAKRAIAAKAAEVIGDGETVLLDGGTTTYEVARLLVGRSLQVVTNSLPVANLFASESRSDLVLLGGGDSGPPLVGQGVVRHEGVDVGQRGDEREALAAELRAVGDDEDASGRPEHRLLGLGQEQMGVEQAFLGDARRGEDRGGDVEPTEELVGVGPEADAGPGRDVAAEQHQVAA